MLAERFTAQLLAGEPARDPVAVAERLLALQGQDPRGVRLAIRTRTAGLSASDVDRALSEQRSLVITWLNRGTLHLVRSEDYSWLQSLTAPRMLTANARRLAQEGISPSDAERAVETIEHSLAEEGPLTRRLLRERIVTAGVRAEGQAIVHLLMLASIRGLIVRGPMVSGQHAFVLVRDWLEETGPFDRERALAELVRRYLRGHAPADERDLAKWSG
ncbi:MAG: DNA glycosylase AlkZ-like family protein, partial [Solirubrobacteraceae bacterium]